MSKLNPSALDVAAVTLADDVRRRLLRYQVTDDESTLVLAYTARQARALDSITNGEVPQDITDALAKATAAATALGLTVPVLPLSE